MFADVLKLDERRKASEKEKRQGAALAKRAAYAGFGGGDEERDAPGLQRQAAKQFGRERYEARGVKFAKGVIPFTKHKGDAQSPAWQNAELNTIYQGNLDSDKPWPRDRKGKLAFIDSFNNVSEVRRVGHAFEFYATTFAAAGMTRHGATLQFIDHDGRRLKWRATSTTGALSGSMSESVAIEEKGLPKGQYWAQQGKTPWGEKARGSKKKDDANESSFVDVADLVSEGGRASHKSKAPETSRVGRHFPGAKRDLAASDRRRIRRDTKKALRTADGEPDEPLPKQKKGSIAWDIL